MSDTFERFNPSQYFNGRFEVEVVGDPNLRIIEVLHPLITSSGQVLYLIGPNDIVYNFLTILNLRKVS